jgi:hypothetical protein
VVPLVKAHRGVMMQRPWGASNQNRSNLIPKGGHSKSAAADLS